MSASSDIPPGARSWRVVAGFSDPAIPNWRAVRAAQYAELARGRPVTWLAFGAAGLLVVTLFADTVVRFELFGWLLVIALLLGSDVMHGVRSGPAGDATRLLRKGGRSMALGLMWALPPALFAAGGSTGQQLAVCLLSCALMALTTLTTGSVPAVLMLYLAPAALGLSVLLWRTTSPMLAMLPVLYATLLAASGLGTGRAFIARYWAAQALTDNSEVVRLLLREFEDSSADWLWEVDSAKRLVAVSPRFAHAAGRDPAALEGVPLVDLLSGGGDDRERADRLRHIVDVMNGRERFSDLVFDIDVGGDGRVWSLSAVPRFDAEGAFLGYRGVGSDITERRRSAEKIDRLARFDTLTGLCNRREFMEKLRKSIGRALGDRQPCALMLIDLDKFKPVNDTLGHPIGDRLLKLVAERLRGVVGEGDVCGRLGGDEFAVLLPHAAPGTIEQLADRVIAALGQPFEIDGNVIRIGASIGCGMAPRDGRSVETLVRNADLALYRAKDDGRGVMRRYDPSLLVHAERRRAMETALREAIDGGDQFALAYQPVIATETGAVEGFEALIRWNHPALGDVPAADFMAVAEEARLATRIGEWTLRTACLQAATWPAPVRLSVNVALAQLHDPQFAATVLSALSHAGLPPHRLELEISESFFLKGDAAMAGVLDAVQALGVRLALDDFGSGYAALGNIRFSRFSAIKINRRFAHGAGEGSRESLAIVSAGVAMGEALGIATVAEGAETHAHAASLRALGLRGLQGRFAGAPMDADAARRLAERTGDDGARDVRRSVA